MGKISNWLTSLALARIQISRLTERAGEQEFWLEKKTALALLKRGGELRSAALETDNSIPVTPQSESAMTDAVSNELPVRSLNPVLMVDTIQVATAQDTESKK